MYIEELRGGKQLRLSEKEGPWKAALDVEEDEELNKELHSGSKLLLRSGGGGGILVFDAKRFLVGAGARALFYPTLLYNVVRNKTEADFRWWDWIDESVLLGAVPFRSDVNRLKALGVGGVVTLNEPYETLVPSSLYHEYGIRHLVLPTRDYLFAPSLDDIHHAVDFIHENASCGERTYVHCKAGRGRSTTVVICYLVKYKHMLPDTAYGYVKSIRPRVLLASAQWQAVQDFYQLQLISVCSLSSPRSLISRSSGLLAAPDLLAFDDGSVVVVTQEDIDGYNLNNECSPSCLISQSSGRLAAGDLLTFDDGSVVVITQEDLDGYDPNDECSSGADSILANLDLIYRVRVVGDSALARLSCLWLRCLSQENISAQPFNGEKSCLVGAKRLGDLVVNIQVFTHSRSISV